MDWGLETMSRIALLIQYIRNTPTHGWEFSLSSHKKQGRLTWVSMPRHGNPPRHMHFIIYLTLFKIKNFKSTNPALAAGSTRPNDSDGRVGGGFMFLCVFTRPRIVLRTLRPRRKGGVCYLRIPVFGFIHTCSSAMFIIGKSDLLSE